MQTKPTRLVGPPRAKKPQERQEVSVKPQNAPSMRMMDNSSTILEKPAQSGNLNGLLDDFSSIVTKPIQDKVEKQLDAISAQVREKLRNQNGKNATDLEVAEYMLGMPTANMAKPLDDIGVVLRNCLIGMTVAICATIYISRDKSNERTNNTNK